MALTGFVYVDKPVGPTSFDIVRRARRALHTRTIGHGGTLDPMASGLLLLAVGRATRLLPFMPLEPKRYRFSMRFGTTTDTLDADGVVTEEGGPIPDRPSVEKALPRFFGEIRQAPPRFSAVRVNGTRAYKLAREKRSFALADRPVLVHSLVLHDYDREQGAATLSVECSTGTYVRALVRDVAKELGTVAVTTAIRRVGIDGISVEEALGPEEMERDAERCLVPVPRALAGLPSYRADEKEMRELGFGRDIAPRTLTAGPERLFVYGPDGELAAVTRRAPGGTYHPERVLVER